MKAFFAEHEGDAQALLTSPISLSQEPDMQKVTGKTDPVEVMHALRELKNNFK